MSTAIKNACQILLVLFNFISPSTAQPFDPASNREPNGLHGFQRNRSFIFSVYENTVGYVGKLSTPFNNATFEMDASRGQKFLNISYTADAGTANLTLVKALDREVQEYFNFTILVKTTEHMNILIANFSIKVLDINDNAPVFVTNDSSFLLGCYKRGSVVTQVRATDRDSGTNGQIQYQIHQPENGYTKFAIDDKGVLTVLRASPSNTSYEVVITAKDLGSSSLNSTKMIKIQDSHIESKTVKQWTTKGTWITNVSSYNNDGRIKSMRIVQESQNRVITADLQKWTVVVNRLITEPIDTSFCLVIKIDRYDVDAGPTFWVINTTVVKTQETVKVKNVVLSPNGNFSLCHTEELETQFDRCVESSFNGSRGGSRASISTLGNKTSVIIKLIKQRYFDEKESRIMNNANINECISNISLRNTRFRIIHDDEIKSTQQLTPRPNITTFPKTTGPSSKTAFTLSRGTTLRTHIPTTNANTRLTTSAPREKGEKKKSNASTIMAYVFGGLVFIIITVVLIHFYRRRKTEQRRENAAMEMSQTDISKTPWREIDKGCIATGKELGSGFFGVVLQGTVILDGQSRTCAIKMLKGHATEADNKDLINELHIIARIGYHPNIINLIGACTRSGPAYIILEFASNGNLLDYLRENREEVYTNMTTLRPDTKLDLRTRLKIAYEVAQGMWHLSSKKCVHRDLAARNILLDEHFVAKVTDFGLSRDVYEEGVYQINAQSKMPLKWMAIESLETMVFTTQSDVWSFGVLMWEIETGGATPYPGLMGREIFLELTTGRRLEKPPTCPDNLYELMSRCWIRDPSERPSFEQLCNQLGIFLQEEAGYEDLFVSPEPKDSSEATTNL